MLHPKCNEMRTKQRGSRNMAEGLRRQNKTWRRYIHWRKARYAHPGGHAFLLLIVSTRPAPSHHTMDTNKEQDFKI
jgi:hypothetical protein